MACATSMNESKYAAHRRFVSFTLTFRVIDMAFRIYLALNSAALATARHIISCLCSCSQRLVQQSGSLAGY